MFRVLVVSVLLLVVGPIGIAVAQTPGEATTTADSLPQITEKEVKAVQQALFSRGILQSKPSGVLDAPTREALNQFQKQEGLAETGRIDQPTLEKLGLEFPITKADDSGQRRNGVLPKIGYAIADGTTAAGKAVGSTATRVAQGAKSGVQKTGSASETVVVKTGETAKAAGDKSLDGAKTVGRGVQKGSTEVAEVTVGRSDESIHHDVRELLNKEDKTRNLISSVKDGRVTLTTEPKSEEDLSGVISQIRKISSVRAVVVINQ